MKIKKKHFELKRVMLKDKGRKNLNAMHFVIRDGREHLEAVTGVVAVRLTLPIDKAAENLEDAESLMTAHDVEALHRSCDKYSIVNLDCATMSKCGKEGTAFSIPGHADIHPSDLDYPVLEHVIPKQSEIGASIRVNPFFLIDVLTAMTKSLGMTRHNMLNSVRIELNAENPKTKPMKLTIDEDMHNGGKGCGGCVGVIMHLRD